MPLVSLYSTLSFFSVALAQAPELAIEPLSEAPSIDQVMSVRFDQEVSATATVIEVKAPDRPGLAWTIADALARLGLDIRFAKIATAKALALDVFYVNGAGGKLAPEDLAGVEAALLAALGGRPTTKTKEDA